MQRLIVEQRVLPSLNPADGLTNYWVLRFDPKWPARLYACYLYRLPGRPWPGSNECFACVSRHAYLMMTPARMPTSCRDLETLKSRRSETLACEIEWNGHTHTAQLCHMPGQACASAATCISTATGSSHLPLFTTITRERLAIWMRRPCGVCGTTESCPFIPLALTLACGCRTRHSDGWQYHQPM